MGWQSDEHPEHEGYAIGFVIREGCQRDSKLYRELGYPRDNEVRGVDLIAAGCECGWRSPHWIPTRGTEWMPHIVLDSESDHERVYQEWKRHLELDVKGRR